MIKVAICFDDMAEAKRLSSDVKCFCKNVLNAPTVDIYIKGIELMESSVMYDLVFLELMMKPFNGLEVARKLRQWNFKAKIIYITNSNSYIYGTHEIHAFDYIKKPLTRDKTYRALDEVMKYILNKDKTYLCSLQTNERILKIAAEDIYYFESRERKIRIATCQGFYYSTCYTLAELKEKFTKFNFAISHKSFLINLLHVKFIKGLDIWMGTPTEEALPLSQKRSVAFKKIFNDYLETTCEKI